MQAGGSKGAGFKDPIKYVDVYRERPIRLTVRVLVPVREHPKVSQYIICVILQIHYISMLGLNNGNWRINETRNLILVHLCLSFLAASHLILQH